MVAIIKQRDLEELLTQGAKQAKETQRSVIVSHVSQIEAVNPLSFFNAANKHYRGERVYWSDPQEEITLVGLGQAYSLEVNDDTDRYDLIEKEWKYISENSLVESYLPIKGTGPILIGGFSFDPLKSTTKLWSAFPAASFMLPKMLLTITANGAWLTINQVITPKEDVIYDVQELKAEKQHILYEAMHTGVHLRHNPFRIKEIDPEEWKRIVSETTKEIRTGELDKVVLARELQIDAQHSISVAQVLHRLKNEQPHSFLFAIEKGDKCFLGASPERLVKKERDQFLSTCLAGTIGRGQTAEEDGQLGKQLLLDPKNRWEHQLVVQMIKNAMTDGCEQVNAPEEPTLYKVKEIQHLYTPVTGIVRHGVSLLSMVKWLHPTPALGGVPKEMAMSRIRKQEPLDRGWYASPIGWLDHKGDGEFAVAIRSGLLYGNRASLFAGCGVVEESDPDSEYKETELKFKPMIKALGGDPT